VGNDSEDFGTLAFDPGRAELSPPDREKLLQLSLAMAQRPELALEVSGVYAPIADRAALKTQRLEEALELRMEQASQSEEELSTVTRRRISEEMFQEAFPSEPVQSMEAQFMRVPQVAVDPSSDTAELAPVLDETAYIAGLRERLIEAQVVSDDELRALADARADVIINVLSTATKVESEAAPMTQPVVKLEPTEIEADEGESISLKLKVSVNEE